MDDCILRHLEELYLIADNTVEEYCTNCTFKWGVCRAFFRTMCPLVSRRISERVTEFINMYCKDEV